MFEGVKRILRERKHGAKSPVFNERMFAAAQHNRLVDWPLSYMRVNGDLFLQYTTIVLRARDLAMNNENVIGLLRNLQRNVIGVTGFTLQSKTSDTALRSELENAWREYCSRVGGWCTLDERTSARDLDILVLVNSDEDGLRAKNEALVYMTYDFNMEHGTDIEPIAESVKTFHDWIDAHPFYQNVRREGVILYDAA